jgi:hypothetical protein
VATPSRAVGNVLIVHVLAPPAGLVELAIPATLTDTHSLVLGHDTSRASKRRRRPSSRVNCQPRRMGCVEMKMFPQASPATHNRSDGQETPLNSKLVGAHEEPVACHARDPPVGSTVVRIRAEISPEAVAAQKCAVGHEIDSSTALETIRPPRQELPFVGFVEYITLPLSTAKHSFAVGQLNAENAIRRGSRVSFQLPAPPAGCVVVIRSPTSSAAAQKLVAGAHESVAKPAPE